MVVMKVSRVIKKIVQRGRERVLLVEETERGYLGSELNVRGEDLVIKKQKKIKTLTDISKSIVPELMYDRIILALRAENVATIESSVSVFRVHQDELIDDGELDSLLFHALWSFLNKFRPLAAKKLNASELDLVIANIAVFGVKLQGHNVFNPLGFSGKEIEFSFRVSFISRSLLPILERIARRSESGPIVTERGAILASMISRPGILFDVDKTKTLWYEIGDECGFRGSIDWGYSNIYTSLGEVFGVSSEYIYELLPRFSSHRISLRVKGIVEKIIRDEYKQFKEFADTSLKAEHHESLRGEGRIIHFEDENIASVFSSDERYKISDKSFFLGQKTSLALASFPFVHPQYEYLNQLLRRRAKWLVPLNSE
ncbi:MAG: hypothetical protein LiPW41_421 [Parcubacteria group bacterium LiPW_41]|nr:MAG: hypothetical protein LiPW41_421 [Parcubacteria group bacterium LiPW_41]